MEEKIRLISKESVSGAHFESINTSVNWGGTPHIRKQWINPPGGIELINGDDKSKLDCESQESIGGNCNPRATGPSQDSAFSNVNIGSCLSGTPGLMIAVTLNLFLSISFGQAFFPSTWVFPAEVPRALGVQMFLFSTIICQLVMTALSDFPSAMGMMMVENIPFMHIIATTVVDAHGMGIDSFPTVLVAFALSSVVVGVFFFLLGKFKIGNAVYFFPRHVIIACIGGIGIFIIQTGLEVATNKPWSWTFASLNSYLSAPTAVLWLSALGFEAVLRIILALWDLPLLPPFYFVSIPIAFYAILLAMGVSLDSAHAAGWFFERAKHVDFWLMWQLMDLAKVDWSLVGQCIPTIIALTIFSLMHVPINIPSLSMSTGRDVDMNRELIAHGYSNVLSGLCGGLQNYLCYSNSLLYFKCNGGGKVSGFAMSAVTAVFFFIGPSIVFFIPRVMPGCLLVHIGIDLAREALWDSIGAFDIIEYSSVVAITVVMTFYGMTYGLALGVICAAFTFTLQTSRHVAPVRRKMCARTLRSSRWRTVKEAEVLDRLSWHITAVQLQGHLFFGNATLLAAEIDEMLSQSHGEAGDVWFVVLDFTLVVAIDSSAAESISKLFNICRKYDVRLCYSRGSGQGFPCASALSDKLHALGAGDVIHMQFDNCVLCGASVCGITNKCLSCGTQDTKFRKDLVFVSDNLDDGLAWCEDILIAEELLAAEKLRKRPSRRQLQPSRSDSPAVSSSCVKDSESGSDSANVPICFQQIYSLCVDEPSATIQKIMSYFHKETVEAGSVLWVQGAVSDRALLLVSGKLLSTLQEEEGSVEFIKPGHLVGEYGLINRQRRQGTLTAVEASVVLVLSGESFDRMVRTDPYLAFVLSKICMGYLGHRVMHVANRIWESHCLPV